MGALLYGYMRVDIAKLQERLWGKFSMRVRENQENQRVPRLGSEVRFSDGITAGRIRGLGDSAFVVIRGKKRIRKLVFAYSSIAAIGNRVVTLRESKAEIFAKSAQNYALEKEGTTKKQFIREIDERLGLDDSDRAERIARITFYLLSKRLSASEKKHLKKNLPTGIRSLWATVEQQGMGEYFNMSDFLVPIKKQGRLETMEEAFIAAREVFAALKRIMPAIEAMEISRSLPRGIQEIWESTTASFDTQSQKRAF